MNMLRDQRNSTANVCSLFKPLSGWAAALQITDYTYIYIYILIVTTIRFTAKTKVSGFNTTCNGPALAKKH